MIHTAEYSLFLFFFYSHYFLHIPFVSLNCTDDTCESCKYKGKKKNVYYFICVLYTYVLSSESAIPNVHSGNKGHIILKGDYYLVVITKKYQHIYIATKTSHYLSVKLCAQGLATS